MPYSILATLTLATAGGSKILDLDTTALPEILNKVVAGAKDLGISPEIKATLANDSGILDGSLQIGSGSFWLPIPDLKLPIPAEVEMVLALAEGITGAKPSVVLDVQLVETAAVVA